MAPQTLFGRGHLTRLPGVAAAFGKRGMIVYGASFRRRGGRDRLRDAAGHAADWTEWEYPGGEPTLRQVDQLRAAAHTARADWIAAIGGGSVLDAAKAAAGLFRETAPVQAFHEGQAVRTSGLPLIAVPTTAGTGAEATPNAVLTDPDTRVKKSIRDNRFMARAVILDPDLLAGCPPAVIAASGMDALTQAIESWCSLGRTAWSDAIALAAIRLIAPALPAVFHHSRAPDADALMAGSHMAGIALAAARLGVVHGLAHPLGALYGVPHGQVCALCLPPALELNRTAIGPRFQELEEALGHPPIPYLEGLIAVLRIANPFRGRPLSNRSVILAQTLASGSTASNPKPITAEDVAFLLDRLFA